MDRTTTRILVYIMTLLVSCQLYGDGPGQTSGTPTLMDVHGAGAQRSDPKVGDPGDYPEGHGPQGDVIRIYNYLRPVRLVSTQGLSYPIVDTGQVTFFDSQSEMNPPDPGQPYHGQDAGYSGLTPDYRDNGDGTISDLNTGLMWQQDPGEKMGWTQAHSALETFNLGGYQDWRIPTIKELYSLMLFSGRDISVSMNDSSYPEYPFIDEEYFHFEYGDTSAGERSIDAQYMSSTLYVSTTMNGAETVFGVNFADGRIKGYPTSDPMGGEKEFFVIYVRGNSSYGQNQFVDNQDGTITDLATGLMWLQEDSEQTMNWEEALDWAESLDTAGYSDWRLPDAKELQSIVDYTRSPDTTQSAAIDPLFHCSAIVDEGGNENYGYYWASTTHADSRGGGAGAVYVAFGEALGFMSSGRNSDRGAGPGRREGGPPPPRR